MSGGLDALEAIGRKTVDIISEGDPGMFLTSIIIIGFVCIITMMYNIITLSLNYCCNY